MSRVDPWTSLIFGANWSTLTPITFAASSKYRDARIDAKVKEELNSGLLWPEPLIQFNPSFEPGRNRRPTRSNEGILHETCREHLPYQESRGWIALANHCGLHRHQEEAVRVARTGANYVLTTGTGLGKA